MDVVRSLVLWFADWPVTAFLREQTTDAASDAVIAIVHGNTVVACSVAARAEGVRRGQRRRDAQARCPRLQIVPADPVRDQRAFSPVVSQIEELAPGVQIIRPGLCALRARGPARYYGGENAAACAILDALAEGAGLTGVRAGVADGPFTAARAARATRADDPVRVVPAGQAAAFLAPLPVTALDDPELAHLLGRLGVHTLGAFVALGADRVRERFGDRGTRLHDLAAGADSRPVTPRVPPPELDREVPFEPPLELAEQVAFGMRIAAAEFIAGLGARGLVCTELRVELTDERGRRSERVWLHPGSFDAAAVVDRVRWQLGEDAQAQVLRGPVAAVRIAPERVDAASVHQPAIFGGSGGEKVHHALSRVQAMLGHRGVLTPEIGGGRWLAERQVLVPWGDRGVIAQDRSRPWPGSLPAPLPATVFPQPQAVDVAADGGLPVDVDERGALSAPPAQLTEAGRRRAIVSWAGPWTVDERGWDRARARRAHRFQVVDADQSAWLLICEDGRWAAEARYD
ncbi:DNA polymerase Y family protein [Microbacterium kribbense]|uniref:DNA polymerase Y family protein n=1 Tax=Microbacterium kribbense TaxID=433645 RepID=A0ABP7GAB3_9MICO